MPTLVVDDPGPSSPSSPASPSHLLLPGQTGEVDSPDRSPSKSRYQAAALAIQRARSKEPTPTEADEVAGPPAEERVVLNARGLLDRHRQAALDAAADAESDADPDDDRFGLVDVHGDDLQPGLERSAVKDFRDTRDTFFDPGPDSHHPDIGSEGSFEDEEESSDATVELNLDVLPGITEDHVEQAFKEIDYDRNGYVGASEIRYLLMLQGEKPTDEEIDEMLRMLECNGDGQVDYRTFRMLLGPDSLVPYEMEAIMATSDSPEKRQKAERTAMMAAKDEAGPTTTEVDLMLKGSAAFKGLWKKKAREKESSLKLPDINPIKPGANRARPGQPKPPLPLSPNQSRIMRQAQRDAKAKAKATARIPKGIGKGKEKGKNQNIPGISADAPLEKEEPGQTQTMGLKPVGATLEKQRTKMLE